MRSRCLLDGAEALRSYTGAPFYSCFAAQRTGADLGHIICDSQAGNVIKTYSPDLIVHPLFGPSRSSEDWGEELDGILDRMHALVIGPGLGRDGYMQDAARYAIRSARKRDLHLVLDADALWLVSQDPSVVKSYRRAVLTPNVVEFKRLCDAVGVDAKADGADAQQITGRLATALGHVTVVQKGAEDVISNGEQTTVCDEQGGLKRSGGQGDILSGTLGTFLAWGALHAQQTQASDQDVSHIILAAALGAATVTRTARCVGFWATLLIECSRLVYNAMGRALQTSDCLQRVGEAFETHFGDRAPKL